MTVDDAEGSGEEGSMDDHQVFWEVGEAYLWPEQNHSVHLKAVTSYGDPVELTTGEARRLAQMLEHLADFGDGPARVEAEPRRWGDPGGNERMRIDLGHVDPKTEMPYKDPKAAVPHVHAFEPDGTTKIVDEDGNSHFPLRDT